MKPNMGEAYRVAFDSANSELNDILAAFEDLRARKERIEKVVMALKPLLGAEEAAAAAAAVQSASDAANDSSQPAEEVPTYQYQATNGTATAHQLIHSRVVSTALSVTVQDGSSTGSSRAGASSDARR